MKSLLRAALVAAALTAMAPLTMPAARAEGASEHNQPYAYRHHRDHDREWRRDHDRHRDRYSDRRYRDDDNRYGHRRHRNDAEDRFWRLFRPD